MFFLNVKNERKYQSVKITLNLRLNILHFDIESVKFQAK